MVFEAEAVIPVETEIASPRIRFYDQDNNIDLLTSNLNELEARRDRAQIRMATYQQRVSRHYNNKVRQRRFQINDLVLRRVMPNTRDRAAGTLGDKWEGPYQVVGIAGHGAYQIAKPGGGIIPRPWNAQYLKTYYQ